MEEILIILFIILLIVVFSEKRTSSGSGVIVKPRTKTPRPKLGPAPQSIKGKK